MNVGNIKVNAPGGEWLMDPYDFTIDSPVATSIEVALNANTNVTEQTASSNTSGYGTQSSGSGDINIDTPIAWDTAASLTLDSSQGININSTITVTANGTLNLNYNGYGQASRGDDEGGINFPLGSSGFTGNIQFTGTFGGNPSGSLTINGTSYTLVNANNLGLVGITGNYSHYALVTNITVPSGFTPISLGFGDDFNGLGHTISGFAFTPPPNTYDWDVGLFDSIPIDGGVENLGVTNVDIHGSKDATIDKAAGLAVINYGEVLNCYSTGYVHGWDDTGGLVADNDGLVVNSYSTANVTGFGDIGGLVGVNDVSFQGYTGIILNSYATGSVSGTVVVGGLAGGNSKDGLDYAEIIDSYSTGSVIGIPRIINELVLPNGDTKPIIGVVDIGGLVGGNYGIISNSYWSVPKNSVPTVPTNVPSTPSTPISTPVVNPIAHSHIPYKTYALRHNMHYPNNINVMKCHCTLSPKQSSKFDKGIVKIGGEVAGKAGVKLFNKFIKKTTGLRWSIPKNVLKKAVPNNGGGPT